MPVYIPSASSLELGGCNGLVKYCFGIPDAMASIRFSYFANTKSAENRSPTLEASAPKRFRRAGSAAKRWRASLNAATSRGAASKPSRSFSIKSRGPLGRAALRGERAVQKAYNAAHTVLSLSTAAFCGTRKYNILSRTVISIHQTGDRKVTIGCAALPNRTLPLPWSP